MIAAPLFTRSPDQRTSVQRSLGHTWGRGERPLAAQARGWAGALRVQWNEGGWCGSLQLLSLQRPMNPSPKSQTDMQQETQGEEM